MPPATVVGPGFFFSSGSDLVGPQLLPLHWRFRGFSDTDFTRPVFDERSGDINIETRAIQWSPMSRLDSQLVVGTNQPVPGQQVGIQVDLVDARPVVVDTGRVQLPWSIEAAPTQTITALQTVQEGTGGFTATDRQVLNDIQSFVQRQFANLQGIASATPIGSVLSHPPVEVLSFCPGGTLVGRGALVPPQSPFGQYTFGLQLTVGNAPAGAGLRDGAVQTYIERAAQLVQLIQIAGAGTEYVKEVLELHLASFAWYWQTAFPARILYDVTPGWQIAYEWICLTGP